jgi:RNA 2',3'-cyclic 3'-phosphodiesterase
MRLFLAIDPSERVRSELGAMVALFRKHDADVKWVEPQQFHLTLKFLPEVDDARLDALRRAVAPIAASSRRFALRLASLGGFPDLQRPKILWVGADEGKDEVQKLAGAIDLNLESEGFARELRAFSVHLTLGRVRSPRNLKALLGELKWMPFSSAHRFDVDQLRLYKSTLTDQKAVHEVVETFPLGK